MRRIIVITIIVGVAAVALHPVAVAGVDFIVPGVTLESVDFKAGADVSYLVIVHAYETSDTSVVRLSVQDVSDDFCVLEISSGPFPSNEEETATIRFRLAMRFKEYSTPDEIFDCIDQIRVRNGTEPFRIPTQDEIEEFDLKQILLNTNESRQRRTLPVQEVETRAGSFPCDVVEYTMRDVRAVNLGGVEAERLREERSVLWFSSQIPFWGLVKSRVEMRRTTTILSASVPTAPQGKQTVTESVLLSFKDPFAR
ncbi:MAG: hypothetical protein JSV33_10225 [bacterium]|nr:MAG: hypothetical protein JSV33_10225 [bacterium]